MLQFNIRKHNRREFLWELSVLLSLLLTTTAVWGYGESKFDRTNSVYNSSYALVIGIDNYDNNDDWTNLRNAESDSVVVGRELESKGFSVQYEKNLKSDRLEDVLKRFFYNQRIDDDTGLFIWFSGHGHTSESESFLVPADAPGPNDYNFKWKALPIRRFEEWTRLTKAKHVYMVFDCCFSSTIFSKEKKSPREISVARMYKVRQFLCSCAARQHKDDSGIFRAGFIKALRNEVDVDFNGDNYLTGMELYLFIKKWMADKSGKNQTPQFGELDGFDMGDFVFSLKSLSEGNFQDDLKDGGKGPLMVTIPRGSFKMGDIQGNGYKNEKPVHQVDILRIAVGCHEVTFEEYDRFCDTTGQKKPEDNGWGRGRRPVINVSWEDAKEYTKWLSIQTGNRYRLPTEAEWEYMARAGTETDYWWGNDIDKGTASCEGCGSEWGWDKKKQTAPVGSFRANAFGIFDTVGNVWEWTCSEYTDEYNGKETKCLEDIVTGSKAVIIRGGAWNVKFKSCRVSHRKFGYPGERSRYIGFRVVRD